MAESPGAVTFAAFDKTGTLAGVIIGTLDRQRARRLPIILMLQLLAAAHFRLLSFDFLRWLVNSRHTSKRPDVAADAELRAEMLMIAIDPRFRGQRLATRLIDQLEVFFRNNDLSEPYVILTEMNNHAANTIYEKSGAHLAGTYLYHSKQINEWHKTVA
jgi:ribosomal protein S18 acetylase RimI-like enzyme